VAPPPRAPTPPTVAAADAFRPVSFSPLAAFFGGCAVGAVIGLVIGLLI